MPPPAQLIGRTAELSELLSLFDTASLVVVTGPPGVGKSALARAALSDRAFTELLPDELPVQPDEELIFIDGFEEYASNAERLLTPLLNDHTSVLVTSCRRLRIAGATPLRLAPLTPDDALDLFEARARDTVPGFELERSSGTVERLVERLDCLPLAIELAADRLRTFSPADLLDRLDRRFALLRPRYEDGPSLEDELQRSWDLLDDHARECLRQCSVFHGGFDLDAAEHVVRLGAESPWVLDVIEALVDDSLLARDPSSGRGRLRMYECVRDFAVLRSDAPDDASDRHADYYLALGDDWRATSWTAAGLDAAMRDVPNLLAIIDRFAATAHSRAAAASLSLDAVLRYRGETDAHLRVLDRGIASAREADDSAILSELLLARAELRIVTGELDHALDDATEASTLAVELERASVLVRAEVAAAEAERRTGDASDALARLQNLRDVTNPRQRYLLAHRAACHVELGELSEARDIAMHVPPAAQTAEVAVEYAALKRLAYAHYYLGNYEHQHRLNRDALALAERVDDRRRIARARQGLGDAAFARGDYDEVREHYAAALDAHRALGNEHLEGVLLGNLGSAEHRLGELDDAARHYAQSISIHQRTGAKPYEAVVTFARAVLEHEREHLDDAAFHYDRASELFGELKQPDDVTATMICRSWLELLRDDTDAASLHIDWAEVSAPTDWLPLIELTRSLIARTAEPSHSHRTPPLPTGEESRPEGAGVGDTQQPQTPDSLPALLTSGLHQLLETPETLSDESREALEATLQGRLLLKFATSDTASGNEQPASDTQPDELLVGAGGDWFQLPGDETVNLRRRRAHRLLLDRLAELHASDPGTPLDVYDAFEIGWPGESASPDIAAERVYWAVGSLRRLGLEGILLTSDAGYYLDPTVTITRKKGSG